MANFNRSLKTGVPVLQPVVRMHDWSSLVTWQGLGTPTIQTLKILQVGKVGFLSARMSVGTPSATQARLILPTGLTLGGPSSSYASIGEWKRDLSTAGRKTGILAQITATVNNALLFGNDDSATAVNPFFGANGNDLFATNQVISFTARFEVNEWSEFETVGAGLANGGKPGLIKARTPEIAIHTFVSSGQAGFLCTSAIAIAECDNNDNWRIKGRISATMTSVNVGAGVNVAMTLAGVQFRGNSSGYGYWNGLTYPHRVYFESGSGNFGMGAESFGLTRNTTGFTVEFDVPVNAKPTWA